MPGSVRAHSLFLRLHGLWLPLFNYEPASESSEAGSFVSGNPEAPKLDPIGGQALVEGVLMRAPGRIAVAARAPDGSIAVEGRDFIPFSKRHPLLALPVLRGAASLVEALTVGARALSWSAGIQEKGTADPEHLAPPSSLKDKAISTVTLVGSLALALALFQLLPYGVASFVAGGSREHPANPLLFNASAGIVRITLLIGYMWALSFLPDVRRLFQYHGAEHKSIFSHEGGLGLAPDAIAAQPRFHPRCGTSFILIVALTCILFFSLFDAIMLHVIGFAYPNFLVRFLIHLPFVPVVAGLSFELLRLSAKRQDSAWVRAMTKPGLWLQRITTREPDRDQIEVAIVSAKAALSA
ncbi:MAG TPA: DUF1385 domain-containing protein [Fibrobacteria bacterium]|jgi:uncharacterized protein YqhQ|nr:DUF1385 domain-containing protein [Fibrobacteria bacterium]